MDWILVLGNDARSAEGRFAVLRSYVIALPVLLCIAWASSSSAAVLGAFRYHYDVTWGGIGIGTLSLSLGPWAGHSGCYRYATRTSPNAIVKLFYGSPSETSFFCVKHGRIRPERFISKLPGHPSQSFTLDFDWIKGIVVDNKGRIRKIPANAVDSLSIQQAVRLWLLRDPRVSSGEVVRFTMVDDKHLTKYKLQFDGKQTVKTPAGRFVTLFVRRIDSPGKVARFWLAPARNEMPVKSMVKDKGRPAVTLVLAR